MSNIVWLIYSTLTLIASLCSAEGDLGENCDHGAFNLSIISAKNDSGQWNTFYQLDSALCNDTSIWRLDLEQNVARGEDEKHLLKLRGRFSENLPVSAIDGFRPLRIGPGEDETIIRTSLVIEREKCQKDLEPATHGRFKIVSRDDWNASQTNRSLNSVSHPFKHVYVTQSNVICPSPRVCGKILRMMQSALVHCYGDVYSNFYVAEGGMAYEGLGWDHTRSEKALYVHILSDGRLRLPSAQTMASLGLLLWEGVRLGKISEDYELVENRYLTGNFRRELKKWVEWSKDMWTTR